MTLARRMFLLPQFQILVAIICTSTILMVNPLMGQEWAPEIFSHDETMFQNIPASIPHGGQWIIGSDPDADVAFPGNLSASAKIGMSWAATVEIIAKRNARGPQSLPDVNIEQIQLLRDLMPRHSGLVQSDDLRSLGSGTDDQFAHARPGQESIYPSGFRQNSLDRLSGTTKASGERFNLHSAVPQWRDLSFLFWREDMRAHPTNLDAPFSEEATDLGATHPDHLSDFFHGVASVIAGDDPSCLFLRQGNVRRHGVPPLSKAYDIIQENANG